MSYIGIPPFGQTVRTVTTITATASQTVFTPNGGYTVGYVDVYYNGVKLVGGADFNASNGTTVVLTAGATANAVVEIVAYGSVSLADSVRRSGDTFAGTVNFPNNNIIAANGYVGIGNTVPNAPLVIGSASGSFTNPLVQAAGNANSWIQINGQNLNNGNNASTDLVLARSDGTDTSGFIDIGINSNTYAQAAYSIMSPRSGYVFTNGGDLSLGTQTAHNIIFHTGNTTSASERMRITSGGAVGVGGTPFTYGTSGNTGAELSVQSNTTTHAAVTIQAGLSRYFIGTPYNNNVLEIGGNGGNWPGNAANTNGAKITINPGGVESIKFSPTQVASNDANTLDDYEEGSWTPSDGSGAGLTFPLALGRYVKVGQMVVIWCKVQYPVTSNAGSNSIVGLPFTNLWGADAMYTGAMAITNFNSSNILPMVENQNIQMRTYNNTTYTNAQLSNQFFYCWGIIRAA